jgi:hypothetical protein
LIIIQYYVQYWKILYLTILYWETTEPSFGKVEVITSKILRSPPRLGWPLWNICVTNDHGYVPFVVNTFWSFPHSRLITRFLARLTRRDSVASLLTATLYQGNPDRNHKLWNIVSTERYILHMQVLLECCYIWMKSSQWENWNHLFCRKFRC